MSKFAYYILRYEYIVILYADINVYFLGFERYR